MRSLISKGPYRRATRAPLIADTHSIPVNVEYADLLAEVGIASRVPDQSCNR